MNGPALGAGGLGVVALYCAARAVAAVPADILGSLVPVALTAAGCAAALVAMMVAGGRAVRTYRFHIDPGGAPAEAIEHEVAHADKGAQFGGRTTRGEVRPDGSGYVEVYLPRRATLAQHVAVSMAGARGEGEHFWTSPHARGDRANVADAVAHLPAAERDQVLREAEGLSYRRLWQSGQAAAIRRALERTGSYR